MDTTQLSSSVTRSSESAAVEHFHTEGSLKQPVERLEVESHQRHLEFTNPISSLAVGQIVTAVQQSLIGATVLVKLDG